MAQCDHSAEQQAKWFNDGYCPQCADARARDLEARVRELEAALEAKEPSKSQIKRISAMVESAEIKRLEAEVGRLRDEISIALENLTVPEGLDAEELGGTIAETFLSLHAALKGEGG